MAHGHDDGHDGGNDGGEGGRHGIAGWGLWGHSLTVVVFVLVVVVVGFGSAVVSALLVSVSQVDAIHFGLLAACAIAHTEGSRGIERTRKIAWMGKAPHLDLRSIWSFSALLILPPALASAMVVLTGIHVWLRVRPGGHRRPPHRVVYSTATVLIANHLAMALLVLGPGPYPGIPSGLAGVSLIVAAAVVRWLINYMLVVGVIMLDNPHNSASSALGPLSTQALDAGAFAMGVAAAVFVAFEPLMLPILIVGILAFHRCVLITDLQDAASTDDKTGLRNSVAWIQLAGQELRRAERTNSTLGILMVDLDRFGEINETYGHPAADEALRAVARCLRAEIREYDHVGRFGGDEFVIALPGLSGADFYAVAERIRRRIHDLVVPLAHGHDRTVSGLTVSVGGALYPNTTAASAATTVDELLRAADSACYAAKNNGRDRVVLTPSSIRNHQLPA